VREDLPSWKTKTLPLVIGIAGFCAGAWLHETPASAKSGDAAAPVRTKTRFMNPLPAKGSAIIAEWTGRLDQAGDHGLENLATGLLQDAHRSDLALWAPLLARWSATDGAGMIAFLENQASPALRPRLLEQAWFAWGASDPDAAFEAGKKLPPPLMEILLEGIADLDPRKAAEFVTQVPNSQFAVGGIAKRIASEAPELAEDLLARAVYDGARLPFERAKISRLAATDPAAAIAYARSLGVIGSDPVPRAVETIARLDPLKAAAQVETMPSSRSKALSSMALAETWAAKDPEAAVRWIRANLTGPVFQDAMIAAAAASGSSNPAKALDLIVEAGWLRSGNYFAIRDAGTVHPSEADDAPNPLKVAGSLLHQWSRTDPEAARRYLQEKIPAGIAAQITAAGGSEK
jgi:hypothetical protein